jgi:hypothetical protein
MSLPASASLQNIIDALQGYLGLGDNPKADLAQIIGGNALNTDSLIVLISKLQASVPPQKVLSGTTIASVAGSMIDRTITCDDHLGVSWDKQTISKSLSTQYGTFGITTPSQKLIMSPKDGYWPGAVSGDEVAYVYAEAIDVAYAVGLTPDKLAAGSVVLNVVGTYNSPHGSKTFATPGASTFTVPAGVTQIDVRAVSGGGSGSVCQSKDGGFCITGGNSGTQVDAIISVTPGQQINITVGSGGARVASTSPTAGNPGVTTSIADITIPGGNGGEVFYSSGSIPYIQKSNPNPTISNVINGSYTFSFGGVTFMGTNNISAIGGSNSFAGSGGYSQAVYQTGSYGAGAGSDGAVRITW